MSPARRSPPLFTPNVAIDVLRLVDYAIAMVGEVEALAFIRGWLTAAKERST